jgi:hypothetical protein
MAALAPDRRARIEAEADRLHDSSALIEAGRSAALINRDAVGDRRSAWKERN